MERVTPQVVGFVLGIIASAFGAGVSFQVWVANRPTLEQLADAVAPVSQDAKAARAEAFTATQEIRALRKDLARFAGRALTFAPEARDSAGKAALLMYERELAHGVSPADAMMHVLEADF